MTVDSLAILVFCCCCADNDDDADDVLTSAGCIAVNVDGCDVSIGACTAVITTVVVAADGASGITVVPAKGTGDDADTGG